MADAHLPFSDYGELLKIVSGLCANGRSGKLFIISETNCFARIMIADGSITHFEYRLKKDTDAIPLFREIKHGTLGFKEGKAFFHKESTLPATADLLAQLGGKATAVTTKAPQDTPTKRSASDAFKIIENELVEILGPMAALVWEEHLDQVGGAAADIDVEQLINSLATEIDDPDKAEQFYMRVSRLLA